MEKDLKKLNRSELVEVIYHLRVELDRLGEENEGLRQQLGEAARRPARMETAMREAPSGKRMDALERCVYEEILPRLEAMEAQSDALRGGLQRWVMGAAECMAGDAPDDEAYDDDPTPEPEAEAPRQATRQTSFSPRKRRTYSI